MYLFINDINKTDNLHRNSISLSDELQQRVNTASFTLSGYKPDYFDEVEVYEGYPIFTYTIDSITLKKSYWDAMGNNLFRVGDVIDINIPNGTTKTITSITPDDTIAGAYGVYPFRGNANDESGNSRNGTVSGATLVPSSDGIANNAYDFDGVDDYIELNDGMTISSLNISAQENAPAGIFMKPDGTRAYVVGTTADTIYQYTLSIPGQITSATVSGSFSIGAQDNVSGDISLSQDGTKLYMVGVIGDAVYYYNLLTAWDITTCSYVGSFSIAAQEGDARGLFVKPDGTKFYIVGTINNTVYQYSMSTPGNMATASYDGISFSVSAFETATRGLQFKSDGTKFYIVGSTNDTIIEFSLSSAWNISTAIATGVSLYIGAQEGTPQGICFSGDGMKLYLVGATSFINQYNIPSAWNFSLFPDGLTILTKIKADSIGETAGRIFDKSYGVNAEGGIYLAMGANRISTKIGSGSIIQSSASSITYGNYYEVEIIVSTSGLVTHYINGVVSGTPSTSGISSQITTVSKSRIGNRAGFTDRTFDGTIEYVKIYSGVLTEEQRAQARLGIGNGNSYIKLGFSEDFTTYPNIGDIAGRKRFAGNIVDISDKNKALLGNVEFDVTALDHTRVFDKKLINDSFTDRDARYIVNDFCNTTINRNIEIEDFDYADTTVLRTKWTNNPTLNTSDYREGDGCMTFPYASVGTGSTVATLTAIDTSEIVGGRLAFWYNAINVTSIRVEFGSTSGNYVHTTFTPESGWVYWDKLLSEMTVVGTPNYASITHIKIEIVSTGGASIDIDGIRVLEGEFFRHYPHVQSSVVFDDFRINRVKPTETMQRLADNLEWYWFVDYDRNIWLFPNTTIIAPIEINETSNNFSNLSITHDTSRLINRQVVRGGEETSTATYSQVVEGNSVAREWIMKNKFKNLSVKLNDGTSTDTMEVGTTTTNVKATAHGLVTGDYIVNRTRSNAVREITRVDADNFTVDAVTSQTNGDSFSLFVSQVVGVEGINADASYDYMSNYNEKSIRSAELEPTITSGQFLLFQYNEVIPILVQITDNTSMMLMKSVLGYTDGIFDGQPIVDTTITSRSEAIQMAEATVNKYSNVVITATFQTEQEGLEAGQLIRIKDTTSSERNIDQDFIIQSVKCRQIEWGINRYYVTCSSLLFGMLELLQQLLANNRKIKVNEDEVINNIEDASEVITISEILDTNIDGEITAETMIIADSASTDIVEPPFFWGPTGLASEFQWEESVWS